MQLSDREKITSRTSEKNQRACMYVGRPIQTKAKVKTNQQRFLKIQGRGAREPGGAAALCNNKKKASHREKITSRISFSLPPWYDGSSRGLWNHETCFDLREFLPLFLMMMMMMMQHATPLSPPPPRRHPSFFQNHFQHTNQSKNKREREKEFCPPIFAAATNEYSVLKPQQISKKLSVGLSKRQPELHCKAHALQA